MSNVNRNDPCPCGSGKKFKKCCMGKAAAAAPAGEARADTAAVLQEAQTHLRAQRLGHAILDYERVLEIDPGHRDALAQLGLIMGQVGQPARGVELLTRAIAVDGRQALYHGHLASQLIEIGRAEAAMRAAERALELDPTSVWLHCVASGCLDRMNRVDDAVAMIRRGLRHAPEDAQGNVVLAGLLRRQGHLDEARRRLDGVLADSDLDHRLGQRAQGYLGTVLDKQADYAGAFEAFRRMGLETERNAVPLHVEPATWTRLIKGYRERLTPDLVTRWKPGAIDDGLPAPAFLVGFPRSGTTMTEQILAAHPRICSSDEQQMIAAIKTRLAGTSGEMANIVDVLETVDRERIAELRSFYWSRVEETIGGPLGDRVFVDKLPLNIVELGLINVLFPEAKIIVALRDPRDVCLSCFFQDFRINAAMMHFTNLPRTVEFYRQVMDLYLHLKELITLDSIEIRYEDTVRDLEKQARRIFDLLGLDWDPSVLSFHEKATDRVISTPSREAVTAPVHTRAIGRWHNYHDQFDPLQEKLAPFVAAFGYERSSDA